MLAIITVSSRERWKMHRCDKGWWGPGWFKLWHTQIRGRALNSIQSLKFDHDLSITLCNPSMTTVSNNLLVLHHDSGYLILTFITEKNTSIRGADTVWKGPRMRAGSVTVRCAHWFETCTPCTSTDLDVLLSVSWYGVSPWEWEIGTCQKDLWSWDAPRGAPWIWGPKIVKSLHLFCGFEGWLAPFLKNIERYVQGKESNSVLVHVQASSYSVAVVGSGHGASLLI